MSINSPFSQSNMSSLGLHFIIRLHTEVSYTCALWPIHLLCCHSVTLPVSLSRDPPPTSRRQLLFSHPCKTEEDTCPVAALLRARRQLPSGGMEEWHEVVAARGRLWQRLVNGLPPDSHSDRVRTRAEIGIPWLIQVDVGIPWSVVRRVLCFFVTIA